MDKAAWIGKSSRSEKPWGYETTWSAMKSIQGKELYIKEGCRTSLKYHTLKDEVLFLMSGRAKVEYADENWLKYKNVEIREEIMLPGQYLAVQSLCVYRITAETSCVFVEISNRDTGKTVRLEDDYGRETDTDE